MQHAHKPYVITGRNVNGALHDGLWWLAVAGREEASRNGPVLVAPGPVTTHYTRPQERVLFAPDRDANPFFHMYEAMWMMAGRNDAATVGNFARTMESFADDNGLLNGAYGYRWRNQFGVDQLRLAAAELTNNPTSRRVVIEMWDPGHYGSVGDFEKAMAGSRDVPCNTHVYLSIDNVGLNMTVCNRSNDMVWGGYGANYVHMGFLQEVLAGCVGVPVGSYYQMSNNFHVYPDRLDTQRLIRKSEEDGHYDVLYRPDDRYDAGGASLTYVPVLQGASYPVGRFLDMAERLAADPLKVLSDDPFWVRAVWLPMMTAHAAYKDGDLDAAISSLARNGVGQDWTQAGVEWLQRRMAARTRAREGAQS